MTGVYVAEDVRRERRQVPSAPEPGQLHALLLSTTTNSITYSEEGSITVLRGKTFVLSLVGKGMETVTRMKFTTANNTAGGDCKGADGASHHQSRVFPVLEDPLG